MRRNFIIVFCVAALLLFSVNASFAQGPEKKWGIGARISYYAPDDSSIGGVTFDPDENVLFEGNLTWLATNWLSLEFTAGYTKTDVNAKAFGVSFEFGEVSQIPLLLTGRLHWWSSDSKWTLYGGGGIGYYSNDADLSSIVLATYPGSTVDLDNSFGFHLAAGLEGFFAESWAINLDLKYVWNEADVRFTFPGLGSAAGDAELDAFVVGIGVKYYF